MVGPSRVLIPPRQYVEPTDKPVALRTQTGDCVGPELARRLAGAHHLVLHDREDDLVEELRRAGVAIEAVPGADVDLRPAEDNTRSDNNPRP